MMLCVIGECLIDLLCDSSADPTGRTFRASPGGSPLNIAVGLARLGHPTALLARQADDAFGRLLSTYARDNHLDVSAAPKATEPSTAAIVTVGGDGRASYDFYVNGTADWMWRPYELEQLPAGVQLLHTGSLASWLGPGCELIAALCQRLRKEGQVLLSYDPNVRAALMGPHDQALRRVERSVMDAHIVKASDEDINWLYPERPAQDVVARWLGLGAHLVVLTSGPTGATAYRRAGSPLHVPARSIDLQDTVGAGDAFMSGLLSGLVDGGIDRAERVRLIADDSLLAAALERAILVSAITCERAGANPPTRAELAAPTG